MLNQGSSDAIRDRQGRLLLLRLAAPVAGGAAPSAVIILPLLLT